MSSKYRDQDQPLLHTVAHTNIFRYYRTSSVLGSSSSSSSMERPHAVVVPYPGSGNINPALQLAKLLHGHGVYITFVNTEHNHRRALAAEGAAAVRGRDGFRFETIPDGLLDADRDAADYDLGLSVATSHRCAAPLRELVARLNGGGGGAPPVTCMVFTALMSFALDVARELGLPTMVLWGGSAASLMAHMRIRELRERGYIPLKDESLLTNGHLDTTIIDWIPGMPPISLGDISSFIRTTDADDFALRFNEDEANCCIHAGALVLNTFDDLEHDVLAALRAEYTRVFTVGPLGNLLHDGGFNGGDAAGLSLWKQDTECLAWLDAQQQPGAVVYVAGHIELAMESGEMWRAAARWKDKAEAAARPGGSSYENLQSMEKAASVATQIHAGGVHGGRASSLEEVKRRVATCATRRPVSLCTT
uniref:Uncharacterized protein n=1 Tax=Oryza punctata TaxID=4537 RepID=A0A0E0LRP6_ORYPU